MSLIEEEIIERVRAGTDLVHLIGCAVKLKRVGSAWKGLCPFHQEKSASFHVTPARGRFHCFGCGASGDCIDFVAQMQGVNFLTALKYLGDKLNINVDAVTTPGLRRGRFKQLMPDPPRYDGKKDEPNRRKYYPDPCCRFTHDIPNRLLDWIKHKGITRRSLCWAATNDYLGIDGGKLVFFYEQGAVKIRPDLSSGHSCFWAQGFAESPWMVEELDGRDVDRVVICEGESDTLRMMAFMKERQRAIGIPGASWLPSPVMCWRIGAFREVVLGFDGDKAGYMARDRISALLKTHAKGVRIFDLSIPEGKDVCECSQNFLTKSLDSPVSIR